jgi:hypothetical protein
MDCCSLIKIFDPGDDGGSSVSIISNDFIHLKREGCMIKLVHVSRKEKWACSLSGSTRP